jgi:hypothetical protein
VCAQGVEELNMRMGRAQGVQELNMNMQHAQGVQELNMNIPHAMVGCVCVCERERESKRCFFANPERQKQSVRLKAC